MNTGILFLHRHAIRRRCLFVLLPLLLAGGTPALAQWTPVGNPIAGDGGYAGWSVSLSADGKTLAVGAFGNNGFRGQTKIYQLVGGAWTQQGNALLGEASNDRAGRSVSLSSNGQTLAVGAYGNNGFRGQTKVYQLVGGVWTQQGSAILGDVDNDALGYSVSLSADGQTVAVGAIGSNSNRGQAKVYQFLGGVWTQQGSTLQGLDAGDQAGYSISLSADGKTLAVGSPQINLSGPGLVRIYKLMGGEWTQQANDILGGLVGGGQAGRTVALSSDGQTVAVGSDLSSVGQVRVFQLVNGVWAQQGSAILGEATYDQAGWSVSLSADGQTLAIGSPGNSSGRGQTKIYQRLGGIWTLMGSAIPGDAQGDNAGGSVSLSADGKTVAIGAYGSGQTKVYRLCALQIAPVSATLCSGASLTLTASGESGYRWNSGQTTPTVVVSPTATTPYSVSGTDGFCSVTTTVTVIPAIVAQAGASSSTVLVGNPVSLSASGGTTYQWMAPGGAYLSSPSTQSLISAIPMSSGVQTFTVVVGNGSVCSQSLLVSITALSPPDLTPTLFTQPTILYGNSTLSVVVNVVELANQPTTTPVILKITKDAKVTLSFSGTAVSVGGRSVDNTQWLFDDSTPNYYTLTSRGLVPAGGMLSVGLSGRLTPASTTGSINISASISGGDGRLSNNVDADRIEYFP